MRDGLFWLIPLAAILAWPVVAIFGMRTRARIREMEIRERIAMIEKGLVPPPEKDPDAFDRIMRRYDRPRGPGRYRRIGIILTGLGFGLMMLISATDELRNGLGVGGLFVALGLAILIGSLFDQTEQPPASLPAPSGGPPTAPPGGPSQPGTAGT